MEFMTWLSIIRKRLWQISLGVLLCSLGAWYYSQYAMTPVYEASATLIVNKSSQDNEGSPSLDINQINSNIMLINSYKVILSSASIMDKVVSDNPELNVTSEELRDRIEVVTTQNSQIIVLKMQDGSYEQARRIVNAISKVFQQEIPEIMKVDNITILDVAQPQTDAKPVSPKKALNIILAAVVSLMIGIGLVLALEYFDDTVKTEKDIEKYLDLALLGTVGKMKKKDLRLRSKARTKKQAGESYAPLSQ